MAGSISLSLSQQFDSTGAPLNGGLLYFYAAGTTTPQSAYQDSSLTLAWPNPIVLDSAGRVPPFYLADGQIKIRLADSAGVTQVQADNLLVVGASSGSGTAPTVDATSILATGDIKAKYGTGVLTGFVRANGRTIGSATSGASERANADCQSLFEYLWTADANLSVSTGRGASANADWVANKTMALPDARGRILASLDDMGNTAAGRLTSTYWGSGATTLGSSSGAESSTLVTANLPAYTPTGTFSGLTTPSVMWTNGGNTIVGVTNTAGSRGATNDATNTFTSQVAVSGTVSMATQGGLSTPVANLPPMLLVTNYIKL